MALAGHALAAMLGHANPSGAPMCPVRDPAGSAADADESDELLPPTPDEDGPHDVPDDTVIEKTLPAKPLGSGSDKPR